MNKMFFIHNFAVDANVLYDIIGELGLGVVCMLLIYAICMSVCMDKKYQEKMTTTREQKKVTTLTGAFTSISLLCCSNNACRHFQYKLINIRAQSINPDEA